MGVPPFPVKETGAAAGISSGPTYDALRAYEKSFIDKGYYAEAYRNVSNGKRKVSGGVMDFIVDDLITPLHYAMWGNKSTGTGSAVWARKYPDYAPYVAAARAVILADAQSESKTGI